MCELGDLSGKVRMPRLHEPPRGPLDGGASRGAAERNPVCAASVGAALRCVAQHGGLSGLSFTRNYDDTSIELQGPNAVLGRRVREARTLPRRP